MKKILIAGSLLGLIAVLCLQVFGATSVLVKSTILYTNTVAQINIANDKTELATIINAGTNSITVSGNSAVSGSSGVAVLAPGGSVTFSKGANAVAGMKLYAIITTNSVAATNTVYVEQWIQ